jgi:hypothetical protein
MEGERKLAHLIYFYKKQQKQLNKYYRISVNLPAIIYLGQLVRIRRILFALYATF